MNLPISRECGSQSATPGNAWRMPKRALPKRDANHPPKDRHGDCFKRNYGVPIGRGTRALNQNHRFIQRNPLPVTTTAEPLDPIPQRSRAAYTQVQNP